MGRYTFLHTDDEGMQVGVVFDDTQHNHISSVIEAFSKFLLGVTFQRETIEKYIDTNRIDQDQLERMRGDL
jgi:hypothetical protein